MLRSLAKYWLLDIKHSPWGKKARRLAGGLGALLSKLGLNFEDESYRVDGAQSTFEGSVTHSASTNGTMTGSDGTIKWRPHNLWDVSTNPLAVGRYNTLRVSASDGTSELSLISSLSDHTFAKITADASATASTKNYRTGGAGVAGEQLLGVIFHAGTHDWFFLGAQFGSTDRIWFNAQTGQLGSSTASQAKIKDLGGGFYLVSGVFTCTGAATISVYFASGDGNITVTTDGTETIYVSAYHCGRSDLGGMVDNPDRGDSYVPTTSSAVYLPRRGHHIYNGYEWVNEGMLHESEARTNLVTYSEDFTDPSWVPTSITRSADQVGPDGITNSATTITATNSALSYVYAGLSTTAGPATGSIFVKEGTASVIWLYWSSTAQHGAAYFDLSDESVQAVAGSGQTPTNLQIQKVGTFYRVSASWIVTTGTTNFGFGNASAKGSLTTAIGNSLIIYGAQLETGSTPSSYIPTSGATVTRAAESLIIPAANLPWPTPNVIGSELVTNGGFDTDTSGWSSASAGVITWVNGAMHLEVLDGDVNGGASQNISTEVGKAYVLSFDVLSVSTSYYLIVGTSINKSALTATGSQEFVFVATSPSTSIAIYAQSPDAIGSDTLVVDNISVKEIDPLSVSIQMNGRMTYADTGAVTEIYPVRWGVNSTAQIQLYISTQLTPVGRPVFVQQASGVADIVYGPNDAYSPGVFVPFNIASRHGSTFINGAVDGVALTADTTPTALPDLSTTDLNLGYHFMGTIQNFQIWDRDIGDTGLVDETAPSLEPSLFLTFDGTTGSYTVTDWSE